jgi:2-polyprenyl-6-methoxyphenol hydroxylase-like FAD-dependent oxidoreductase
VKNGNTTSKILVVGGGFAGSTAATLLSRDGFDVTMMEKAIFPRYLIGESLIPPALEMLDYLAVRQKVEAFGFVKKPGIYFRMGEGQVERRIWRTSWTKYLLLPSWRTEVWSQAERAKGQAWGLQKVPAFHAHGTPPVDDL